MGVPTRISAYQATKLVGCQGLRIQHGPFPAINPCASQSSTLEITAYSCDVADACTWETVHADSKELRLIPRRAGSFRARLTIDNVGSGSTELEIPFDVTDDFTTELHVADDGFVARPPLLLPGMTVTPWLRFITADARTVVRSLEERVVSDSDVVAVLLDRSMPDEPWRVFQPPSIQTRALGSARVSVQLGSVALSTTVEVVDPSRLVGFELERMSGERLAEHTQWQTDRAPLPSSDSERHVDGGATPDGGLAEDAGDADAPDAAAPADAGILTADETLLVLGVLDDGREVIVHDAELSWDGDCVIGNRNGQAPLTLWPGRCSLLVTRGGLQRAYQLDVSSVQP